MDGEWAKLARISPHDHPPEPGSACFRYYRLGCDVDNPMNLAVHLPYGRWWCVEYEIRGTRSDSSSMSTESRRMASPSRSHIRQTVSRSPSAFGITIRT